MLISFPDSNNHGELCCSSALLLTGRWLKSAAFILALVALDFLQPWSASILCTLSLPSARSQAAPTAGLPSPTPLVLWPSPSMFPVLRGVPALATWEDCHLSSGCSLAITSSGQLLFLLGGMYMERHPHLYFCPVLCWPSSLEVHMGIWQVSCEYSSEKKTTRRTVPWTVLHNKIALYF